MWTLLLGCHGANTTGQACACDEGFGAQTCTRDGCGPCSCLTPAPEDPDPAYTTRFYVDPEGNDGDGTSGDPWAVIRWDDVDQALALGPVAVWFARGTRADKPIEILRRDEGDSRLVIDGDAWGDGDRASAPGVTTTEVHRKRSRITVRGFQLSDTDNQGVYWDAGDDVVLEDLVVTRNGKSPGIFFNYANRSGLPSSNLTIRNNHVFDVRGECIYVGGVEDQGGESHSGVVIERNLIHHCGLYGHHGDDWDGINVKDGLTDVVLRDNVVYESHWGIQLDSPVEIDGGLIYDVRADGVMMGGNWGDGFDGAAIRDLVVLRAGASGIYVGADQVDTRGLTVDHVTVDHASHGLTLAGDAGIDGVASNVLFTGSASGISGWGTVDVTIDGCGTHGTPVDSDLAVGGHACTRADPGYGDRTAPAGPDGVYFTDDDGWHATALVTAGTDGPLGAR